VKGISNYRFGGLHFLKVRFCLSQGFLIFQGLRRITETSQGEQPSKRSPDPLSGLTLIVSIWSSGCGWSPDPLSGLTLIVCLAFWLWLVGRPAKVNHSEKKAKSGFGKLAFILKQFKKRPFSI